MPTVSCHWVRLRRAGLPLLLLVTSVGSVLAQVPRPRTTDTLSARARDSLIAAILADTLDEAVDPAVELALPGLSRTRQSVTLRPTVRSYRVGAVDARETATPVSYALRRGRTALRLDLTPVAFRGDTSTQVRPPVQFSGASPVSARLDVRVRDADTLRLFGQTASFPGVLSGVDATALGAVGTGTIDLDAYALGVTARLGARYALSVPLGDGGVLLGVRAGVEHEPRPSGTQPVSWRGTTLRGGVGLTRTVRATTLGAHVDLVQSLANDSLGGRNLFPGGGSVTVDGRLAQGFGADEEGALFVNVFYSRPIGLERPDQPTRLIPIGDFMGATVSSFVPLGRATLLPSVSWLRESSSASARVGTVRTALQASGWTTSASLGVSVPVGDWITLTPEAGVATGTVQSRTTATFPRRPQRPLSSTFSDAIRGGWVALEVTLAR